MPIEKYPPDIWFPLQKNWDWQKFLWDSLTIPAKGEQLLIEDKDLLTTRGWIWAAALAANSPYVGVKIEYTGPKGRLFTVTNTLLALYSYGFVKLASPSTFSVTRWAESVAPEYAMVLFPGFLLPFQPKGSVRVVNTGVAAATVYSMNVFLLLLWED